MDKKENEELSNKKEAVPKGQSLLLFIVDPKNNLHT
jgi:hypothetical protein